MAKLTYKQFITEISTKVIGSYLARAGEAVRSAAAEQPKNMPVILKRSKGIKAAKARPLPFYPTKKMDKFDYIVQQIPDLEKVFLQDRSVRRYYHELGGHDGVMFSDRPTKKNIIEFIAKEGDPTPNHEYTLFLARLYSQGDFQLYEDLPILKQELQIFHKNKNKLVKKDINKYEDKAEFFAAVDKVRPVQSGAEIEKLIKQGGMAVIAQSGDVKIIKPKTFEATQLYCKGTKWCFTSDKETFDGYIKDLYIIIAKIKGKKRKFAIHPYSGQFMIEDDTPVLSEITGILEKNEAYKKFMESIFQRMSNKFYNLAGIDKSRQHGYRMLVEDHMSLDFFEQLLLGLLHLSRDKFNIFIHNFHDLVHDKIFSQSYRTKLGRGFANSISRQNIRRYDPEIEKALIEDALVTDRPGTDVGRIGMRTDNLVFYATHILHQPWKEAEPAIAQKASAASKYAQEVLKKRFPLGEPAISKNPSAALSYSIEVLKKRWPEGEDAIAEVPFGALRYMHRFLKGKRFEKAEIHIIAYGPSAVIQYIKLAKQRIPALEKTDYFDVEGTNVYAQGMLNAGLMHVYAASVLPKEMKQLTNLYNMGDLFNQFIRESKKAAKTDKLKGTKFFDELFKRIKEKARGIPSE